MSLSNRYVASAWRTTGSAPLRRSPYDWREDVSWSHYFGRNAWATPIDGHLDEPDAIDDCGPDAR